MAPIEVPTREQTSEPDWSAEHRLCEEPKTPGRRDKRLRFSEPLIRNTDDSSTGLTPALNRTILISEKSVKKAKQRPSLPAQLGIPAGSSSTTPTEIQFAPLTQMIDSRTMRRLKRNHLGEEINKVYAEKSKAKRSLQQQIEDLRKEVALAREQGDSRQEVRETSTEDAGRIAELEKELANLKEEMAERFATIDRSASASEQSSATASTPMNLDDSNDVYQNFDENVNPGHQELGLATQSSQHVVEAANQTSLPSPTVVVTEAPTQASPPSPTVAVTEASTQANPPSPELAEILRSARLALENIFPGEITLELNVSDPEPLVASIISHLKTLSAKVDTLQKKASVSETSQSNMERNFKNVLYQLEGMPKKFKALRDELAREKRRAGSATLEIATFEARCEQANGKVDAMKKQRDEHQRAVERLQPALEHYQNECDKLTNTIMEMESAHQKAMTDMEEEISTAHDTALSAERVAFEEAKSDLAAHVAAETLGRKKAEESAIERLTRIKELENHQKELQATINEKQAILRTLDEEVKQFKVDREQEVGQLNVRISELNSDLDSTSIELGLARDEISRLSEVIEEEKAAGLKAVEKMQETMEKSASEGKSLKSNYIEAMKERDGVSQSFGLITPVVEGGRFRDAEADEKIDGHVELVRGKKTAQRPDSGVEIWDDMMDLDDIVDLEDGSLLY
ncbi:MAG: hypothetical protein LQ350_001812 [Teloschistes chrysophthalmus]|nr:MAG: hypothetical protein LQ350_001812 [Niorma chrysophthalma]